MTRLSDYGNRLPIRTAEQAINRGSEFLSSHGYPFNRIVSAKLEGDNWAVLFDVSIIGARQLVSLTIDSQIGDITEFAERDNK